MGVAPGNPRATADAGRSHAASARQAVVMVSSVAPIKAKKLRYYADANFKRRVAAA